MDTLKIEKRIDSPMVLADGQSGYFEVNGKSLPENAVEFYKPLENYVREYIKSPKKKTIINLKLEYLNTSSSKKILDIIGYFESLPPQGYEVELNWYHRDEDQDMIDEGIEFAHMTSLKLNFIVEQ